MQERVEVRARGGGAAARQKFLRFRGGERERRLLLMLMLMPCHECCMLFTLNIALKHMHAG